MKRLNVLDAITHPFTSVKQSLIGTTVTLTSTILAYTFLPAYHYSLAALLVTSIPLLGYAVDTARQPRTVEWQWRHIRLGATATLTLALHALPIALLAYALQYTTPGTWQDWTIVALTTFLFLVITYALPYNMIRAKSYTLTPLLTREYLTAVLYAFAYFITAAILLYLTILFTYSLIVPWLFVLALAEFATVVTTFHLAGQALEKIL